MGRMVGHARSALRVLRGTWMRLATLTAAGTVGAALLGFTRVALAGLAALLWFVAAAGVRIWRRMGLLAGRLRGVDRALRAIAVRLRSTEQDHEPFRIHTEANIRRILIAVERGRVEASDEFAELAAALAAAAQTGVGHRERAEAHWDRAERWTEAAELRRESDAALLARILEEVRRADREAVHRAVDVVSEAAALHNLYSMLDIVREMPLPGGFAVNAQTLLRLTRLMLESGSDGLVVECGSGTSTVWMAQACRQAGRGRVVALEHEEQYAARTRAALAAAELTDLAEVRLAPLEPVILGAETHRWYARAAWHDLDDIAVLFVDGPPQAAGPRARYGALPLLAPALRERAIVLLDDFARKDESEILASWMSDPTADYALQQIGDVGRTRVLRFTREIQSDAARIERTRSA